MMIRANSACRPGRIRVRRGAIGVIERDRRVLLIRRAAGIVSSGLWCFPGGHIEAGETSRRAVCRELAEELGIQVRPLERIGAVRIAVPRYVLAVWRVGFAGTSFSICADEVAEIGWFTPTQVRSLKDGMPSNERVLAMLGL